MDVDHAPALTRAAALRVAAVGAAGLAVGARPAAAASTPGDDIARAARAFLDSLPADARARATFPFAGPERTRWHWTVPASVPRNGLPLGAMTVGQRRQALALLRASTSASGYRKAVDIMALQGVLQEMSGGAGDFDADLYYVSVFGTPGGTTWGWRFEGHHLSRHFTLVRGRLVVEPFFLGAWPTRAGSAYRSVARRAHDAARGGRSARDRPPARR